MSALDLLHEFEQLGVRLWCEGDALKFEAPKGVMTLERKNLIKQNKLDLLAYFCAGGAPMMIEPLDHANDEPVLSPKMHRALSGLDYLMNQKRHNLHINDYDQSTAMVSREEWRTKVMRVLNMRWQDMDTLEDRLYSVGALGYEQGRIYVVRGDDVPRTRTASADNPDFMLSDDSGDSFRQWLYS